MPRAKRPLAEADPNGSRAGPNAKKGKTSNTDIQLPADKYGSMTKEELSTVLRGRNMPHTGTKKVLVQRLEEVNGGGHKESKTPAANENTPIRRQSGRHSTSTHNANGSQDELTSSQTNDASVGTPANTEKLDDSKTVDYTTKDNSKLRNLLHSRFLLESGTREKMIARLESNPIDYKKLSSSGLTEMLKRSHVTNAAKGTKESKIERLKESGAMDHDLGSGEDGLLIGKMMAYESKLASLLKEKDKLQFISCSIDVPQDRNMLNSTTKVKSPEDRLAAIARVENDERILSTEIQVRKADYERARAAVETALGHPIKTSTELEKLWARDADASHRRANAGQKHKTHGARPIHPGARALPGTDNNHPNDYSTKDNGKLRTLLLDREMSSSGTREEMITRLESSTIKYESYTSAKLSKMLNRRHMRMCEQGSKDIKIQRLKIGWIVILEIQKKERYIIYRLEPQAWEKLGQKYASWRPETMINVFKERKLPISGNRSVLLRRLRSDDRKALSRNLKEARGKFEKCKAELESMIGHPANATHTMAKEHDGRRRDDDILLNYEPARTLGPICEYNCENSQWATKSEHELIEICARKKMPGHGPKAAMLKWLDMGVVGYGELYGYSLETLCRKRGLRCRRHEKKDDMVRMLKKDDERGGGS
ncbi:hypothetical protein LSUE1_G001625 [Lachnellula suecica]|uniref:SAP domain-containing protein n=1 Tax=Lachnellula suecica TaxID=602035 RepID=A0A8T9CIF7_9HELO|nr:hypothetical protein LSUE1_G001625 [Lachnellula suecica]